MRDIFVCRFSLNRRIALAGFGWLVTLLLTSVYPTLAVGQTSHSLDKSSEARVFQKNVDTHGLSGVTETLSSLQTASHDHNAADSCEGSCSGFSATLSNNILVSLTPLQSNGNPPIQRSPRTPYRSNVYKPPIPALS